MLWILCGYQGAIPGHWVGSDPAGWELAIKTAGSLLQIRVLYILLSYAYALTSLSDKLCELMFDYVRL